MLSVAALVTSVVAAIGMPVPEQFIAFMVVSAVVWCSSGRGRAGTCSRREPLTHRVTLLALALTLLVAVRLTRRTGATARPPLRVHDGWSGRFRHLFDLGA